MKKQVAVSVSVIAVLFFLGASMPLYSPGPPDWSVTPGDYDYDGSITSAVFRGVTQVGTQGDKLGAFVGGDCRGVADAWDTPLPGDPDIFLMTVYSNQASGESLSFKYYDSGADIICDITEKVEFVPDMTLGSLPSPFQMHTNNCPPYVPSEPSPTDSATDVPADADLGWLGGDADVGNTVTYYVYFGTDTDPAIYDTTDAYPASTADISYELPTLELGIRYYWKIIAEDNHGSTTPGPIWNFVVTPDAVESATWGTLKAVYR